SFFFSSRRRHTRSKRDWSSDVCSSDLAYQAKLTQQKLCSQHLVLQEITFASHYGHYLQEYAYQAKIDSLIFPTWLCLMHLQFDSNQWICSNLQNGSSLLHG